MLFCSFHRYLRAQSVIDLPITSETEVTSDTQVLLPDTSEAVVQQESRDEDKIAFADILRFPAPIWLICVICVTYYVAVFPFISLGLVFFRRELLLLSRISRAFVFDRMSPFHLYNLSIKRAVAFIRVSPQYVHLSICSTLA